MTDEDFSAASCDALLNGRLHLWQPLTGYRVAIDPLFLAAAVPARAGQRVLDVGCGVGTAALALACRVEGLDLTGLEIQDDLLALAARNSQENAIALNLWGGDLAHPVADWPRNSFDHVISNPPFHGPGTASPVAGRAKAHQEADSGLDLAGWIRRCSAFLRPGGCLTLIHRADRLDEVLAALSAAKCGATEVIPLWPRAGEAARRIVLRSRKGRKTPLTLQSGLILHEANGALTAAANAILRDGAGL